MIKVFNKVKTKALSIRFIFRRRKRAGSKGLLKKPLFYFGLFSFILLLTISFGNNSFADPNGLKNSDAVFFNKFFKNNNAEKNSPFFSKNEALYLETPDLKIVQDNSIYGISTPRVLSTQVLGSIFGESPQDSKDTIEYSVEPGDTLESIANYFNISLDTLLWANGLSKNSQIKVGQKLVVLPVSGVIYIVKSGDTLSEVSKVYKSKVQDIVAFNDLSNERDIFIGDILVIPNGIMPAKAPAAPYYAPLASSFFIFPAEGRISQGKHPYNAGDIANKCGTPIHAAAPGQVTRVRYGYNFGGGNSVSILHSNGVVTTYGHLMTILVKSGDRVDVGDRIALMGGGIGMAGAGKSTGCHLHFGVIGAENPFTQLGRMLKYSE